MSPRAGLDRDIVVRAAADLVNAEGMPALTIQRLAERLRVRPSSLYNHVGGLPDLARELARLSIRALGERMTEAAVGQSGAEAVRAVAQAYRGYILENAGLYQASLRSSGAQAEPDLQLAQEEQRVLRVATAVIRSLGLEGEDAVHAVRGLRALVHGFATLEAAGGFGMPLDCDESFRRLVDSYIQGLESSRLA